MSRASEIDAFSDFVREHGAGLRRTAFLLTRDWYLAEDLVQSALIRTFERRHRIRDPKALVAYTRKVISTVFLSGRRLRSATEIVGVRPTDTTGTNPTDAVAETLGLWVALGELTDMQRAVLVLRYYGDASEAEIADAVGCSRGSVKTHASRGLAALRRTLGPDLGLAPREADLPSPSPAPLSLAQIPHNLDRTELGQSESDVGGVRQNIEES